MIFVSDKVREAHGLPVGWQAWHLEVIGDRHLKIEGGVYPGTFTKGPRKGRPNYRKPSPGTERMIVLSVEEYRTMMAELKAQNK